VCTTSNLHKIYAIMRNLSFSRLCWCKIKSSAMLRRVDW